MNYTQQRELEHELYKISGWPPYIYHSHIRMGCLVLDKRTIRRLLGATGRPRCLRRDTRHYVLCRKGKLYYGFSPNARWKVVTKKAVKLLRLWLKWRGAREEEVMKKPKFRKGQVAGL